jgi:hypothetical protein
LYGLPAVTHYFQVVAKACLLKSPTDEDRVVGVIFDQQYELIA